MPACACVCEALVPVGHTALAAASVSSFYLFARLDP